MASDKHVAHVQQMLAKSAGGGGFALTDIQGGGATKATPAPRGAPAAEVAEPVEEVQAGAAGAAADAEAAAEEAEAEAQPEPVARPARVGDKLRRSVEIEKRAIAVRAKVAAETRALAEQKARDDRRTKEIDSRARQASNTQRQLTEAQRQLEAEQELLHTNPFEWARQRGLTGQQLAEFARGDRDPSRARDQLIQRKVDNALAQVRKEANDRISALEAQIAGQGEGEAQQALLEHVSSDDSRFEALNTIYSPEELLTKAADLAEKNVKLQWGWDGDRLCEELEARARKDSRWSRIQTRFAPKPKTSTAAPSSRQPATTTAADRETREAVEQTTERTPRAQRPVLSARDKHRLHVQRLTRTVRFG